MSSSEDRFRALLVNFKKRLTPKEQDDFQYATLEDVRSEIARIQAEQGARKEMMNMPRIQSFLEAMDQFGKVVEVFLNSSEFVAFIWGPLKFALQVASNWAESFDILLGAYEQIGEQIPLLQQFRSLFDRSPYMGTVLEMIYSDILEFHKGAMRFFSHPVWRQVFRSAWKDFKTRFQHILDSLHRHRGLIESQANLLYIQQYQCDRLNILDRLDKSEEEERQKKYTAVMEWVLGAHATPDHDAACDARSECPGSGLWILKNPKLKNWKDADLPAFSTLWLNGIPGAGKTVLASVIIEACVQDKSFTTSFFYSKHADPEKNKCNSILKGILSQLMHQYRDLVPFCHEKYLASGELTLTSATLIKQLFDLFCQTIPKQYIIIDGLDECDITERRLILSFFNSIVERFDAKDPGKIRVLFVSQDETDIKKTLSKAAIIVIEPADSENDIRSYVRKWTIEKIQRKHELNDQEVEYIIRSTCARAKGMFLFAKLVMLNLDAQPTKRQLQEEIKPTSFPRGLEQAYGRIIGRIAQNPPAQWRIARKLLGWMVCAKRPLKWHEIQGAVSADPVEQTVNFAERKLRVHIRDLCGSLIQVLPGDRVELVHSTAKFYITQTGHVHTSIVESDLTALCLQYLTFECFDQDVSHETLLDYAVDGYFAFQDYAIAYWSHHLIAMTKAGQHLFSELSDSEDAIKQLEDAVNDFASVYEEELSHQTVVNSSEKACEAFRHRNFYLSLQLVWSHVYRHQEKGLDARNDISLKALSAALIRNRKLLEELTASTNGTIRRRNDLDSFYGDKRYKCPKLTCFYFHEGFKDASSRLSHINRHDRPFQCSFSECLAAEFGFGSRKDLEKHMKSLHPAIDDEAVTFAAADAVPAQRSFECSLCEKKFTRKLNLRDHLRSHNGERPFACPDCGKAFTRLWDRDRHRKTIHARR